MALSPPPTPSEAVVIAAGPLAAGTVLARADLTVREVPRALIPQAAATAPEALVGRSLSGPVTSGSILTEASVADAARWARPGFVVVSLPLPNGSIAPLLRPGVEIDLYGPEGVTVAAGIRVLSPPEGADGFGAASRSVLVEVVPDLAARLAPLAQAGALTIAVH